MNRQGTSRLLQAHVKGFKSRPALYGLVAPAFQPLSAPQLRPLCISTFSACLALILAWMGAELTLFAAPDAALAAGTTRYVATTGSDLLNDCSAALLPCRTVQHAADQSGAGDEVRIAGGTYAGVTARAGHSQHAYISTTLTIRGGYTTTDSFAVSDPVANPTVLDAGGSGRVFFISGADASIANLTAQNGNSIASGANGGGINASDALTLTNVTVISNTADGNGGGVYVFDGATTLSGGLFENNGTSPSGIGGGLVAGFGLALSATTFVSNSAASAGGAFVVGPARLNGGLFQGNHAVNDGGGLISNNVLVLTGTRFLSNTAAALGGGMVADGAANLNGGLMQNNRAAAGGGIYAYATLALSGTEFLSNTASSQGGGARVTGPVTVSGGLFQNNRVGNGSSGSGGGLFAFDALTVTSTQFLGNSSGLGGGIYQVSGAGRVVNALFARNSAASGGEALHLNSTDGVQILHSTIASPTVGSGYAIYVANGNVGITDTIVASYTTGIYVSAGAAYEDYNLFFGNGADKPGTTGGTNDVPDGDPKFVNPQGDDYHLGAGSPAIDAGVDAGVTTDFEGDRRPTGGGFDVGYDERLLSLYLPLIRR